MITLEAQEQLQQTEPAFLTRIRLRAQRRILWLRKLWSDLAVDPEQGLAIADEEIDFILGDLEKRIEAEDTFYKTDELARKLSELIDTVEPETVQEQRWLRLRQEFGLSEFECDLLSLAVAVEIDPSLGRVYGYLHDDATACYATPWLASSLFQWLDCELLGPESGLSRWHFARPAEGTNYPWSVRTAWVADPHLVLWIVRGYGLDPALGEAIQYLPTAVVEEETCLYPDQLEAMQAFVQAIHQDNNSSPTPVEIELVGPLGAGKRTLAVQLCASLGADLLAADAKLLLGGDVPFSLAVERAMRAARSAYLNGALLYWHNLEGVNPQIWQSGQGYLSLTLFGTQERLVQFPRDWLVHRVFQLPVLARAKRMALWQQLTGGQPVPKPVSNWLLTPAEIAQAAQATPAGSEAVVEVCRQMLYRGTGKLFMPLPCPYTWDDIVLEPTVKQHLAELEAQAQLRWEVYEEWGFERLCPLGRGITAMFAGPSGTGKTMAAQVLARSLDLELYRIDLAGVVNKYIGETEKRLKQVFDICERANVVLFFDEADALFGQRTQVKDAHDRFANIEIDYLLQRMEQFDGIAILATNRKGDIDPAFLRRLRFIVDFMPPGPAERLTLWQKALLPRAPSGEELLDSIDWQFLAERLNMTGADIKSAALSAAFLARRAGTRITMEHILHGAQREMFKHGMMLRLEDWEG